MRYLIILLVLAGCRQDETLTAYAPQDTPFSLIQVNEKMTHLSATLTFGADGAFSGQAPCNRYFGQITVPYPWFGIGGIGATRKACPKLADEAEYFNHLGTMSLAEISGSILILSNDAGENLVFKTHE